MVDLLLSGRGDAGKYKLTVEFKETGTYKVFVRTKDWVARWEAPGQPGKFQLAVNGKPLSETFGMPLLLSRADDG